MGEKVGARSGLARSNKWVTALPSLCFATSAHVDSNFRPFSKLFPTKSNLRGQSGAITMQIPLVLVRVKMVLWMKVKINELLFQRLTLNDV